MMTTVNNSESFLSVQTSLAAAMELGLEPGRFYRNAYPGSLNLLLTYPQGCQANCSYCGLARERSVIEDGKTFIRVKWPEYQLSVILDILQKQAADPFRSRQFGRICVSMITHKRAAKDCIAVVKQLRRSVDIPVSVLVSPTLISDTKAFFTTLKKAGVDRVGVAIDTATADLFMKLRGKSVGGPHQWEKYWETVGHAVTVFGSDYASIHLVVGLGETEQEMVTALGRATNQGAQAHLFSFCAEPGSALAGHEPPSMGQYRRMQLAAYLLNNKLAAISQLQFNTKGQLIDYGQPLTALLGTDLAGGQPFMTSGCPNNKGCVACNRPFGNERPGPLLRNYPFVPSGEDMRVVRGQIWEGVAKEEEDGIHACCC